MKKHILFFILFPIAIILIGGFMVFYLDLANGPLYVLSIFFASLAALVVISILLLRKKMRWRLIPWGGFLLSLSLVFALAKPSIVDYPAFYYNNPVPTDILHLEDGDIRGVYNEDKSVEVYAGIPYAAAPIGENRWKEPQPVEKWKGVRNASYFASKAMQIYDNPIMDGLIDIYAEKSWHPDFNMKPLQKVSEDCLYLNIWKPAAASSDNLPILMYIHGGSLTSGSSAFSDYNGETMAKHGVIMITIAYRLGVFGYFAHPDLAAESENGTTGNYGLLDQIAALKWVKRNASYFGGDPENITIAGESAGSSSVSALCVTPVIDKGFFKNAIMESSSLIRPEPPHTFRPLEEAYETGRKIMEEQGCETIEELRKIPAETLINTEFSNSSMTIDGFALDKLPYEIYAEGNNNETNLLMGYNVKEADAFVVPTYLFEPTNKSNIRSHLLDAFDEESVDKMIELYKERIEQDALGAFNEIISVYWFIHPHHRHSLLAAEMGTNVYRYQFTKENGYYGTYHSGEMVYCYGNIDKQGRDFAYDKSDYDLSAMMVEYWANFAKCGDPNSENLPVWDKYSQSGDKIMELGENVGMIDDRYLVLYPLIDEFVANKEPKY